MIETIKLFAIGIILGIANVIPGVSGGTMAVVFGIYDKLINLISLNIKKIFSQWKFLLPLAIGMLFGIKLFSKIITYLFQNYPTQTNFFFIGIILGSVPLLFAKLLDSSIKKDIIQTLQEKQQVQQEEKTLQTKQKIKQLPISSYIAFIISLSLMILMALLKTEKPTTIQAQDFSFYNALIMFIGLAIATIAMIIPGISGSFMLLALGIYSTVIGAIDNLNILLLIPGALGAAAGLLCGAGLIRVLMKKVPSQTYSVIFALVIGSVFVLFPKEVYNAKVIIFSILSLLLGFAISFIFGKTEKK